MRDANTDADSATPTTPTPTQRRSNADADAEPDADTYADAEQRPRASTPTPTPQPTPSRNANATAANSGSAREEPSRTESCKPTPAPPRLSHARRARVADVRSAAANTNRRAAPSRRSRRSSGDAEHGSAGSRAGRVSSRPRVEPRQRDRAMRTRPPAWRQQADVRCSRSTSTRPASGHDSSARGEMAEGDREHDVKTIGELLADDFVGTSSTGRVGSKSTLLAESRRDKNKYKSAEAREHDGAHARSDDVAVVTGIARETGTTPDGKRFTNSRRFTDTWVQRNGKWRCIASQTTANAERLARAVERSSSARAS